MTDPVRSVAVVIRGRVQGVGYRLWTRGEASHLGLSGHVRNRSDGSVEAAFSGPVDAVARMLDACRSGPPGAHVTEVAITERGDAQSESSFVIR